MLTGVVAILILLLALLAIPVTLAFHVSWHQVFHNDIRLKWAFGLVDVRIPSDRSKAPSREGEAQEKKIDRSKRSSRQRQNVFSFVRQEEFRRRIIRFVSDLWRTVHKENVSLHVRVGLGDPADTGHLWAILGPVAGILTNVRTASIEIEPDFFGTTLELDSSGSVRLIPLQMIYLTIALLLSPPVWKGIQQMRRVG